MKTFFKSWIVLLIGTALLLTGCSDGGVVTNSWPGLSAAGEVAYIANGDSVYAVNTGNGGMIWRFPAEPDRGTAFFATPVLDNDQLIVGDYQSNLYGINPKTGAQLWIFDGAEGLYIGHVLVENDKIYAPNSDYNLYSLDSQQKILWKIETSQALWADPVSDGDVIYQASMDHFLYALDANTGQEIWKVDVGGALGYAPALNGEGKLFIGTLANELIALNKMEGVVEWRFPTNDAIWSRPLLDEGILYFGDISGNFYAVDAVSGTLKWDLQNGGGIVGTPAVIQDGIVYGTETGEIIAVNYNGEKLWTKIVDGEIYTPPIVVGDSILFAITKGEELLKAFSMNGNDLWSFSIPK